MPGLPACSKYPDLLRQVQRMVTSMRYDTRRQPSRYRHVIIATALAVALLAPIVPVTAQAQGSRGNQWVGTWASGRVALPSAAPAGNPPEASPFGNPPRIANQTLRQIVRTSIGGSQVRVALTNRFGTTPLRVGGAHVAIREKGSAIVERLRSRLTFRGQPSVTLEAGSLVVSDPVTLAVPALGDLAIDIYFPDNLSNATSPATYHPSALTTNYLSPPGDHSGAARMPVESTFQQWFYLARVDVLSGAAPGAVVTIGDSITDGTGSTPDTNSRWPDFLPRRLGAAYGASAPAVLNVGIAGNRGLSPNPGLDVLRRAGLHVPAAGALQDTTRPFLPSGPAPFEEDQL